MSKVLYIQASPRGARSQSTAAAQAFLEAYGERNPEDRIDTLNLFEKELPAFDGLAMQAKYAIMGGGSPSPEEEGAWRSVEELIQEFTSADKYVLSVPMWNFHIPYRLKHYLDVIIQPTYTFAVTPEGGYEGLVKGKPVFLVCARGGEYPPGSDAAAMDFQTAYLKTILGFIGLQDVRLLTVEPTLNAGPEKAAQRLEEAMARAREMASGF